MPKHWKHLGVSVVALAFLVTPMAFAVGEGEPIDGGDRNPTNNQEQEYTQETEIIAQTNSYGTRQSNKSNNGGGAIYGCRSVAGGTPANNEPCVRANNLANGLAFEFAFDGAVGGTINTRAADGSTARPFTTNATAVATGLNADRVDSLDASQLASAGAEQANLFAVIRGSDGARTAQRGATASARDAVGDYRIVFDRNVSACAFNATVNSVADPLPGPIGAVLEPGTTTTVNVRTYGGIDPETEMPSPMTPGDRDFHLTVTC